MVLPPLFGAPWERQNPEKGLVWRSRLLDLAYREGWITTEEYEERRRRNYDVTGVHRAYLARLAELAKRAARFLNEAESAVAAIVKLRDSVGDPTQTFQQFKRDIFFLAYNLRGFANDWDKERQALPK
jgi:DNA-binding PadR family transcriptional regulator